MILAPFELHRPSTIDEALELAGRFDDDFDFIAGGTDLLQNYKNRLNAKNHVIALDRLEELRGISANRLGAMEPLANIEHDPLIATHWPGLAGAATLVASPLIRNSGTVGGNLMVDTRCYWFNQTPFWRASKGSCLKAETDMCRVIPQGKTCYAAFSGDLAPVLLALDAAVELASPAGRRTVPLADFYGGDGIVRNCKGSGEILIAIHQPRSSEGIRCGYRKLRHRDTLDYPEMGVAAALRFDDRGQLSLLRCADTAVDTVPRVVDYTAEVEGKTLHAVRQDICDDMQRRADPKKNTAMAVGYRKKMVGVFLDRLLRDLADDGASEVG